MGLVLSIHALVELMRLKRSYNGQIIYRLLWNCAQQKRKWIIHCGAFEQYGVSSLHYYSTVIIIIIIITITIIIVMNNF